MGRFEQSEAYYLKALGIRPDDKFALLGIGSLYYKAKEEDKALAHFFTLLALDDSYVAVLTMVGNIFRRRREYEQAIEYFNKAVHYESTNTFALYGLGDCHRWLKNFDGAIHWWSQILAKEPHNQAILSRVGDALMNTGQMDQAFQHYQLSLDAGFDAFALLGQSKIHRERKQFMEAERCIQRILEISPHHARALEELAEIMDAQGKTARAREIRAQIPD